MENILEKFISEHHKAVYLFIRNLFQLNRRFLLQSDFRDAAGKFFDSEAGRELKDSIFEKFIDRVQVATLNTPWIYFSIRTDIAKWHYYRFHQEEVFISRVSISDYLAFQERIIAGHQTVDAKVLEIDLGPFSRGFPRLKEKKSIGRGVEYLNRHLSTVLFTDQNHGRESLFRFLRMHKYRGKQLMLNDRIDSSDDLVEALREAEEFLDEQNEESEWHEFTHTMQELGFEAGWGRTAEKILESMQLLLDIFEAPSPGNLEIFLGRIPMIFNLVIVSPHGYFGQSNVLGLPDTGGQVVYILDQVRSLEREMRREAYDQGLDIVPRILIITRFIPDAGQTTCNQRIEDVVGTENAKILRIPFRSRHGEIVPHWISRFKLWPYLEQYAIDVEKEIMAELGGKPDLIIGNYSDGNLVATLLSESLKVTQCNIAHALEKTKYLFSDLYWKDNEEQHNFSTQFTADLIAMNAADFIITSTYHEIAGTKKEIGQYESYTTFTMPELYRIVDGIDVFDPKFNIVSPGSDPQIYFPYTEKDDRLTDLHDDIRMLFSGDHIESSRGGFPVDDKPVLLCMSRLDHIKNVTGFVDWYGGDTKIRDLANVLVIAGNVDVSKSTDDEEKYQIDKMHQLMDQYALDNQVRWIGIQMQRAMTGELYRYIADLRGAFVQPALFETFGLTVIEAMISGLPTFATCFGGPKEIIIDGRSGFHIDPNKGDASIARIADFMQRSAETPEYWDKISRAGIERVQQRYTWKKYSQRLMSLARIYGFWKFVSNLEREETRRYLQMFYALMFRPLAEKIHHP